MPAGLIIRDANGSVVMDTSTRVTRVLGFKDVQATGTQSHSGFSQGTPFAIFNFLGDAGSTYYGDAPLVVPTVSFSGTTMTYTIPTANQQKWRIIYGVY